MGGLPPSFLIVVAFVAIAVGLIVYFVSKQLLFRRHKRKGEEALQLREYFDAVESFGRAEALWDFNATMETTPSYLRDLATLDEVLDGLDAAARAAGIGLSVGEYRHAVKAVQGYFRGQEAGDPAATGRAFASAFMRLKNAQSALREELRASRTSMTRQMG